MRIRIISTGKPEDTKIVNAETGETIIGVKEADIMITPFETTAVLVFHDFDSLIETSNVVTDNDKLSE